MRHTFGHGGASGHWDNFGNIRLVEFVRQHVPFGNDDGEKFASGGWSVWREQ